VGKNGSKELFTDCLNRLSRCYTFWALSWNMLVFCWLLMLWKFSRVESFGEITGELNGWTDLYLCIVYFYQFSFCYSLAVGCFRFSKLRIDLFDSCKKLTSWRFFFLKLLVSSMLQFSYCLFCDISWLKIVEKLRFAPYAGLSLFNGSITTLVWAFIWVDFLIISLFKGVSLT